MKDLDQIKGIGQTGRWPRKIRWKMKVCDTWVHLRQETKVSSAFKGALFVTVSLHWRPTIRIASHNSSDQH